MSQTAQPLTDCEILEKLVRAKLEITPRHEKELELLAQAPNFIPKAFLQAYQHIVLEGNSTALVPINECHSQIAIDLGLTTSPVGHTSFHYPVNPGDLPDIDTDFAFPALVKEYIVKTYGEDRVVGIPTYGRYKVRSLLNDLCRVIVDEDGDQIVSPEEVKELNKKLPFKIDAQIAGDMADDDVIENDDELLMSREEIFTNTDIQDFQRKFPRVFEHFKLLYALPKYRGQHAAGVVILPETARTTLPLSLTKKNLCTEWIEGQGVNELGSVGVIKVDILGLKTLKVLDTCNKLIMSRYQLEGDTPSPCACKKQGKVCRTDYKLPFIVRESTGERLINFNAVCLNIPKVYKAIGNFQTQGVFQFEPEGISAFTHKYNPKEFYDLALITALFRPGPLDARLDDKGMPIDPELPEYKKATSAAFQFIDRHNGQAKVYYASPKLEDVLKKNFGIAVFQEDISRIVMKMTGCGFAEAEKVRKFLTKVKPELVKTDPDTIAKLKSFEDKFTKQSLEQGATATEIEAVWNLIVPFSRYGFNKAHAWTYSLISFQTGFCRTLFPLEYLTSLMIHNVHNSQGKDKVIEYIRTSQKLEYKVLAPSLNLSDSNFIINEKSEIVAGLTLINRVGEKAAKLIVDNRTEVGPFTSIEDFLSRKIRWQIAKIDVLKALVHAGAFDEFSPNRALTWAKIEIAKKKKKLEDFEMVELGTDENDNPIKELHVEDYSSKEKIDFEREAFGFLLEDYVTKNKAKIEKYRHTLRSIAVQKKKQETVGTIEEIKVMNQKNGEKYARITATNVDGIKEQWLVFANVWKVYKNSIRVFDTYFALGKKDERSFLVDTIQPLGDVINLED